MLAVLLILLPLAHHVAAVPADIGSEGRLRADARAVVRGLAAAPASPAARRAYAALAALHEARDWVATDVYATTLADLFAESRGRAARAPLLAAAVAHAWARLRRGQGDVAGAWALLAELGVVRDWRIESDEGAPRTLQTRPDGVLSLAPHRAPRAAGPTVVTTTVTVDRPMAVALRFGVAGDAQIRLDGVPVTTRRGHTEPAFDQDEVRLTLAAGANTIAFALTPTEAPLALIARLTAPDGRPLGATANGPLKEGFQTQVRAWAHGPRTTPEGWAEFIRATAHSGRPLTVDVDAVLRALAPGRAAPALLAWAAVQAEPHRRADLLSRILAVAPQHAPARLERARLEHLRQRPLRAMAELRALPAEARDEPAARLTEAQIRLENGFFGDARAILTDLGARFPQVPAALRARADFEVHHGDVRRAYDLFATLATTAGDDDAVLFWLVALARDLARFPDALRWLSQHEALRPDLPQLLLERARVLEAAGAPDDAWAALQDAVVRFPDHPDVLAVFAAALHRRGDVSRAAATYQRLSDIAPEHAPAPDATDDGAPSFEAPFALDLEAVVAAAQADPDPGALEVWLDQHVVWVQPHGGVSRYRAQVVAVGDVRENDRFGQTYRVICDPLRQRLDLLTAYVASRDGTRREVLGRREVSLSDRRFALYYDLQEVSLDLPPLRAGDVVVVAYRLIATDPSAPPETFGDVTPLQGEAPRRLVDYTVRAPRDWPLHAAIDPPAGAPEPTGRFDIARHDEVAGTDRVVRFRARDLPALPPPTPPERVDTGVRLHVARDADYGTLGRAYRALIADTQAVGPVLAAFAATAVAGARTAHARLQGLHAAVTARTRYVGLEFGIHGLKPYAAHLVHHRAFGDCKDTANLLQVLLAHVGVPAEMALVRTRPLGPMAATPASLAVFDHAVVYVPGLDLWIDPTVREAPPGVLPPEDEGAMALRLTPAGGVLTTIPFRAAADDTTDIEATLTVAAGGGAAVMQAVQVTGQERTTGFGAVRLARALAGATDPAVRAARWLALRPRGGTDLEIREVAIAGLDGGGPVGAVTASFAGVLAARRDATGPVIPLALGGSLAAAITPNFKALRAHAHAGRAPFMVPRRSMQTVRLRIAMAPGLKVHAVPADLTLESAAVGFTRTVRRDGPDLVITQRLAVHATSVSAADLPAFVALVDRIDEALMEPVRLAGGAP